jgi:PAS domain S-box-containing protein
MSDIPPEKLLESLFDGVYYVDRQRRITYWNKAAERITGYSKSDVIELRCADNVLRYVDGRGRELSIEGCPMVGTMTDGNTREANVYLHPKTGHRIPISVRTSPVRDADGNIIGVVEIFRDNSNLLQILKEYEKL